MVNNSGQTLTLNSNGRVNLTVTGLRVSPVSGHLKHVQLDDDALGFIAAGTLADGAEIAGDEFDNTDPDAQFVGLHVQLEVTHDEGAAADGTFDIYLVDGDASGELPSDASGYASAEANGLEHIGSLVWESNGGDDEVMRSPVFRV